MSAGASTEDGEDSKQCVVGVDIFIDRMAGSIMCVWWRDRCQLVDAIG